MKPSGHIRTLDGLRGLAVLAVIGHHLATYARVDLPNSVYLAARFGWVGVDLFFVLSGFLITGILWDNRNSRHRLRTFYGRRFLRIVPAYYAVLLVYALVVSLVAAEQQAADLYEALPWHVTYLTNFRGAIFGRGAGPANTGHFWTLAVEEQFYLLWPAVVAMAARRSEPRKTLMQMCIVLIVMAMGFRLLLLPDLAGGAYVLLISRMDSLAVGGFIALWARGPKVTTPLSRKTAPVLVSSALAVTILAVLSADVKSYLNPLQQTVGYTLWAILFGCIVVRAAGMKKGLLARILETRPLVATGRISYGLYLIHYPMIFVLIQLGVYEYGASVFSTAVVVLSFSLAYLSWRFLESPILRLKRHFPYDPAPDEHHSSGRGLHRARDRDSHPPQVSDRRVRQPGTAAIASTGEDRNRSQ